MHPLQSVRFAPTCEGASAKDVNMAISRLRSSLSAVALRNRRLRSAASLIAYSVHPIATAREHSITGMIHPQVIPAPDSPYISLFGTILSSVLRWEASSMRARVLFARINSGSRPRLSASRRCQQFSRRYGLLCFPMLVLGLCASACLPLTAQGRRSARTWLRVSRAGGRGQSRG